jgi:hypothetical protein
VRRLAELTEMLNGIDSEEETEPETPLDEEGGYPSGAQDAPTAPYNQPDGDVTVQNTLTNKLTIIGSNSEIAILEGPDQSQYAFYFGDADLEKLNNMPQLLEILMVMMKMVIQSIIMMTILISMRMYYLISLMTI